MTWLYNQSRKHRSIDTFAKKLYIVEDDNALLRLKIALSSFLSFEEHKNHVDMRYDTFFASILSKKRYFPNSIKILSWNYDRQLEKAYRGYATHVGEYSYNDIRERLNFVTPYNYDRYNSPPFDTNDTFEIIKINGSIYNLQYDKVIGSIPYEVDFELESHASINDFEKFCTEYFKFKSTEKFKTPSLRFAWEEQSWWDTSTRNNTFLDTISNRIQKTDIIVIIGYSFPFFNREVDHKIFSSLKRDKIQKVYIQDIEPNEIAIKFEATAPHLADKIKTIIVNPKSASDEFYLPPELTFNNQRSVESPLA